VRLIALWLALLTTQLTTPAAPSRSEPPAVQPTQRFLRTPANAPRIAPSGSSLASPDASGIYRVGNGVTVPKILFKVDPEFPEGAEKEKISGIVPVSFTVDVLGNPVNVRVRRFMDSSTDAKLRAAQLSVDQAALNAVKQFKFEPATYEGKAVAVYLNIVVNFEIY